MAFVVYNVDLNLGKVNFFLKKKNTRKVITFCPDVSVVNIVGKKETSKSDRNDSESFEGYSSKKKLRQLDPVGSTVRYEMMKLCTGSV